MARYAITILAITAIILAAAGSAGAAEPEEPRELTVLAYNTHLFEDSIVECVCRCGGYTGACNWNYLNYEDWTRRDEIASKIANSGADIVVLQEVWAPCWQDWFIDAFNNTYPYSTNWISSCGCVEGLSGELLGCLYKLPKMIDECCWHYSQFPQTMGNGLVLLSKFPLDIGFERFPTFEQCGIGGCDAWADKGVLTADVDVGGVTIRIGVSHALGGLHDRSRWDRNFIAGTITPFQLKGDDYIFAFDSDNTAHIVRMEDYGRWWDEKGKKYNSGAGWKHLHEGPWDSVYDVVTSFELDGHPYLFRLSSTNHAYIYRINDDPYTGWTSMCDDNWYSTDVVSIESFELDGHPYLFALGPDEQAHITRINDDPCTGWTPRYQGAFDSAYIAVTSFELDGHPYLFALDAADKAYIHRINDDPCTGWTGIYEGPMSSEHLNVTSFELDGHPYLFATHTNNNSYIYRINDNPYTGWTYVYGDSRDEYMKAWYRFEGNTYDSSGNGHNGTLEGDPTYSTDSRGETYSLELDGVGDYVTVGSVNISGDSPRTIAGWVKATADEIPSWTGIFGFTAPQGAGDDTHFDIERSGASGSNHYCIHVSGWQVNIVELDMEWHHLAATYDGYKIAWYADGSRVGSAARSLNTNDFVMIGKRADLGYSFPGLVDDVRIYSRALSQGEIAQLARSSTAVFEMNGHPYLFLQGNCCEQYDVCTRCRPGSGEPYLKRPGEAYMKRINDDPCTGWEDLLQLEDIRIIRDETVVDEDGPPAIMMGDFNIHRDKYGIMNELFGKAGAVDAYIEVHGSDTGGETGDLGNNKLAQHFCPGVSPDDPDFCNPENHPPDRVDYVYVRQSGAGLRLVPTEAEVIRDWTYGSSDYGIIDLSDHYPLRVKFEIFEGGCTARAKGDLNCDRLINFADLAILGSAWMSRPGDGAWDPACDMSEPTDDFIDTKDVDVIAQAWPTAPPVHNVTQDKWYEFIQTAITYARDGDEIAVAPGTYNESINFKKRAIRLYSSGGPEVTTIDGSGHYHVVKCVNGEGPSTVLEGFTITGGNANGPTFNGGGMYNDNSSPTVADCTFSGNSATNGGGMYNDQSSPSMTDCTFGGNIASINGGGIYNGSGSYPVLTNCMFSDNESTSDGGGIYVYGGQPNLTNCIFSGNSASKGGGIYRWNPAYLTNCTFSNNSATENGGGMYNYENYTCLLTNCAFSGNTADTDGGGMYNDDSSPTVTDCNFSGNTADTDGGGMYNYNSSPSVTYCTFGDNIASNNGGGIYNGFGSSPTLTNCIFSGNEATSDGGGIYVLSGQPHLTDCIFSSNSASNGGGIYRWSHAYLTNCTFSNNSATENGGGMYNYQDYACSLTNCNFTGNTAQHAGGMFNDNGSSPTVTNCTFSSNSATGIGGGMYNLTNSSPTVTNCIFADNSAGSYGGGMDNRVSSDPNVTNCTFSNNSATGNGGGMDNYQSSPTVTNCILWGNTAPTGSQIQGGNPTVTYSDVHGGTGQPWFGTGCIDDDPCFVDAGNPDPNLSLKPDSPCIDAGNNSAPDLPTTDLAGYPRVLDGDGDQNAIVDMGAYEYLIPSPPQSSEVDFKYLVIICANWLAGTEPEL